MTITPGDLLEVATELDALSRKLRGLATKGTLSPNTAAERALIGRLSPTSRQLLSYVFSKGGAASYEEVIADLGLSTREIGGRVGAFTRLAGETGTAPICRFEGSDATGWQVVLDHEYQAAAEELENEADAA